MLQQIDLGTDMEDLIREIEYKVIREIFEDEIEDERKEAYDEGVQSEED